MYSQKNQRLWTNAMQQYLGDYQEMKSLGYQKRIPAAQGTPSNNVKAAENRKVLALTKTHFFNPRVQNCPDDSWTSNKNFSGIAWASNLKFFVTVGKWRGNTGEQTAYC